MKNAILEINPQGFTALSQDEMLATDGGSDFMAAARSLGKFAKPVAVLGGVYALGHALGQAIGHGLNRLG